MNKSILTIMLIVVSYISTRCQIYNMVATHKESKLISLKETDVYVRVTPETLLLVDNGKSETHNVFTDTIEDIIIIVPRSGEFTLITDLSKEVYILTFYLYGIKNEIIYYNE